MTGLITPTIASHSKVQNPTHRERTHARRREQHTHAFGPLPQHVRYEQEHGPADARREAERERPSTGEGGGGGEAGEGVAAEVGEEGGEVVAAGGSGGKQHEHAS